MKNLIKKLILISLITAFIIPMAACKNKSDSDGKSLVNNTKADSEEADTKTVSTDQSLLNKVVVSVGKSDVYYSEAMIYFKYIQAKYEAYFGNQIWGYQFGSETFGDMAKKEIIDMIVQTKIISDHAKKYNVTLTEDDELLIQQNAEKFLAGLTEEDKARYGLTKEVAETFYRDNKLYENVYDAATMNVDTDIPDDQAKQIKIWQVMISTTETDADGKVKPLSEQMKAKEYKKVKKLLKEAEKADDFYAFAKANTESSDVEYIFGKGDMPEAFEKVAFSLKSGELSRIVETEEGYHIIYCVSDYDEDATLEKKEEMIEKRQDQYFQSLYKSWAKDYKTNVNDKIWSTLEFTSISNGNTTEDVTSAPLKNTVESSDKITPKP